MQLCEWTNITLKIDLQYKKIKLIKQSHKVFDIFYEQATKGDIYVGGVIQKSKEITLEEVC